MNERAPAQLRIIGAVVNALRAADISAWLFGGWGLDARIGRITREHGDIEFWVERIDADRSKAVLVSAGAKALATQPPAESCEFTWNGVDFSTAYFDRRPDGSFSQPDGRWSDWLFPPGSFGDEPGTLDGTPVLAMSVTGMLAMKEQFPHLHNGRPWRQKDIDDIEILRALAAESGHRHIILKTQRLTLRQFTEGDVDNLFDLSSDPAVMRYLTGGRPTPREEIRDEIIPFHLAVYRRLDRLGTWAAQSSATGEFLGWFHFRPGPSSDITNIDLGYRLRRSTWNLGYATEGSRALINMGFTELGVERVFAHTMAVNAASRRVLEKCGLTLIRTTPHEGPDVIEGSEHGEVEYALTRPEWQARIAGDAHG